MSGSGNKGRASEGRGTKGSGGREVGRVSKGVE